MKLVHQIPYMLLIFIGSHLLSFKGVSVELDKALGHEGLVEVEPNYLVPKTSGGGMALLPYSQRRPQDGSVVGVSIGLFSPDSYVPDQSIGTYSEVFGTTANTLISIDYTKKWNFSWGSYGVDFSVGTYTADSTGTVSSNLSLMPVEIGGVVAIDNIGDEPLFAPYLGGGVYTVKYTEAQSATSFNGTTQAAPYWFVGCYLQLDWIDEEASVSSYIDGGIENSFFFVEAKQYIKSSAEADPNFQTDVFVSAGFKIEL